MYWLSSCLGARGGCAGGCCAGCGLAGHRVEAACPATHARWHCGCYLGARDVGGTCPYMCGSGREMHTHLPLHLPPPAPPPLQSPHLPGGVGWPSGRGTESRWPRQMASGCPAPGGSGRPPLAPRPHPPPPGGAAGAGSG